MRAVVRACLVLSSCAVVGAYTATAGANALKEISAVAKEAGILDEGADIQIGGDQQTPDKPEPEMTADEPENTSEPQERPSCTKTCDEPAGCKDLKWNTEEPDGCAYGCSDEIKEQLF